MSLRKEWKFPYTATALLHASQAKVSFHSERVIAWTDKQKEVMETIKAEGLTIEESLAAAISSKTYNRQATVTIDDKLLRDMDECTSKISEHKEKVAVYEGWVAMMEMEAANSQPVVLQLDHDDWLFFFGKK